MEVSGNSQAIHANFRMAWTAYIRPLIVFPALFSVGALFKANGYSSVGITICVLVVSLMVIRILTIRSVLLYTDDDGVWVYNGIFPWSKGTTGVKWRDIEDAVYFTVFWSWLFKSYTVRIGHRFTKTSEIVLTHIARGNLAVEHINRLHREVLALGTQA